jgi:hypothetical protein
MSLNPLTVTEFGNLIKKFNFNAGKKKIGNFLSLIVLHKTNSS